MAVRKNFLRRPAFQRFGRGSFENVKKRESAPLFAVSCFKGIAFQREQMISFFCRKSAFRLFRSRRNIDGKTKGEQLQQPYFLRRDDGFHPVFRVQVP